MDTLAAKGWSDKDNGELLDLAEHEGYEVLATTDQSLHHQQNLAGRKIGIVVLLTTAWPEIRLRTSEISRRSPQCVFPPASETAAVVRSGHRQLDGGAGEAGLLEVVVGELDDGASAAPPVGRVVGPPPWTASTGTPTFRASSHGPSASVAPHSGKGWLDDVHIHDLRHSYASRALALGEGLPMIGKLLGHTRYRPPHVMLISPAPP